MKSFVKMYDKENKCFFIKEVQYVGKYSKICYSVINFQNEEYIVGDKEIQWK